MNDLSNKTDKELNVMGLKLLGWKMTVGRGYPDEGTTILTSPGGDISEINLLDPTTFDKEIWNKKQPDGTCLRNEVSVKFYLDHLSPRKTDKQILAEGWGVCRSYGGEHTTASTLQRAGLEYFVRTRSER